MFRNAIVVLLLASALLACNSAPKQASDKATVNTSKVQVNKTITLAVEGMSCEGCENTVKQSVEKVPGIASAKASYKDKEVVIAFDSTQARVNDISTAITSVGYEVKGVKPTVDKVSKPQ
jgi:copper chaperone CopZ